MGQYKIKFLPVDRVFPAQAGENLLEVAMKAGIHINASCGGAGSCGKCKIKLLEGGAESVNHPSISDRDYEDGIRLACRTNITGDTVIEIPLESQTDRSALGRRGRGTSVLASDDTVFLPEDREIVPFVIKRYIELALPSADDNISDWGRLARGLREKYGIEGVAIEYAALKTLSRKLRDADWKVTVVLAGEGSGYNVVCVEEGNTVDLLYAIAIDIGTTTVCGQLVDLGMEDGSREGEGRFRGAVLAESSDYNAQISYGEDVISRIMYARKKGGLVKLQKKVADTINKIVHELLQTSNVSREYIYTLYIAGNTTMTHIALGLDPVYIMLAPYTPTTTLVPPVRAHDIDVNLSSNVNIRFFPSVASYVGGDIVAGVLGTGMFRNEEVTLYIDIGTNGEIVIGNKDWMVCASCSAGPAFEGGGIEFGMRAGGGAIEQVRINPSTFEPMILTVGRGKPVGICGSGLIDTVAGLFETGLISQNGKFTGDGKTTRVRKGNNGYEYVVCYAEDTRIGKDIVISEVDLDNLIRTKAAVYAGCRVLLGQVGLTFKEIKHILIAGGFGHYIDVEKAQVIGLLPEMATEKFKFVGNGSLLGARALSLSRGLSGVVDNIAKMMTNIELSNTPEFMEEFIAAMFLPHTDRNEFPNLNKRMKNIR